jgi:hypothetical protein
LKTPSKSCPSYRNNCKKEIFWHRLSSKTKTLSVRRRARSIWG